MIDPVSFREALAVLVVLGGSAFAVEQYIRFMAWLRSAPKGADGVPGNG